MVIFTDYDVWTFKRDGESRWKWFRHSPDGELLVEARASFDELEQCQADATRAGYNAGIDAQQPAA
ncbi:MAG TPA: hypothetical protein VED01_05350 [Burkholderiales bacterium]|nr:hypothetical protein [Burkholderiales bacterium]